jgi:glutathione synthase/RimK-type ligase-like ATP-grasp enzyme
VKLHFILVRRVPPVPSPVLLEVFEILERRGFQVESGIPEEAVVRPDRLRVAHDLYILKSHTELALSFSGVLETLGARLLNPYASCITTQDKIVASRRLRAAGVPIPRCWITGDLTLMAPIAEHTPLIVKPHRGHRGAGISIVRGRSELAALQLPDGPVLIQEHVTGGGEDLKVYVVGEDVFAVRKQFSPTSFTRAGRSCAVSPELREIALACGRTLGLGLYGLDVLETDEGPIVVDVNYFPGYKGVSGVAPLIADYIEDYAHSRQELELPPLDARPRLPAPVGT